MWSYMGPMGWWMALWWVLGFACLVLIVWVIGRAAGSPPGRMDETPEQILKRRYARGELEHDEYQRRLDNLRR